MGPDSSRNRAMDSRVPSGGRPRLGRGLTAIAHNVITNLSSPGHDRVSQGPSYARLGGPMGLKVSVIGGGSTYTPELIEGLAARADRLPIDELVLQDVNPARLEIVGGLARRMLERLAWRGRLDLTEDPQQAIDGASFVLIQLRIGGPAARLIDENPPPRFGTIGQETTGAGGFAKALRTLPVVLDLAELTARRGAPGAWIVDFTNPVGIVTQALLDEGHRAIGLCNVAIGLQRRMAVRFRVEPERVELEHVG